MSVHTHTRVYRRGRRSCRTLKKYHSHEELPARAWLAKWGVMRTKLIPLALRYPTDRCDRRA